VLKGNKPLCLRIHRQHRVVLYASDYAFIDFGLQIGDCGFEDVAAIQGYRSSPQSVIRIRQAGVSWRCRP